MLQQLKMDLILNKKSFLYLLLLSLVGFAFGVIMVAAVMHLDSDPGSWFCMGTLMALISSFAAMLFLHGFFYKTNFLLALSMGRTRSCFMVSNFLILLLEALVAYGLVLLFYAAEMAAYPLLYADFPNEVSFSFLTNWRIVLPTLVILPLAIMFLGTMYAKFGKTAGIIIYFLWMFCCLVLPRTFDVTSEDTGLLNNIALYIRSAFLAAPAAMLTGLGIIVLAAMVAATWIWGKQQMVK